MSIICKTKSNDVFTEAKRVHAAVQKVTGNPRAAMTVLSCYAAMEPALIDAVAISTLGVLTVNGKMTICSSQR